MSGQSADYFLITNFLMFYDQNQLEGKRKGQREEVDCLILLGFCLLLLWEMLRCRRFGGWDDVGEDQFKGKVNAIFSEGPQIFRWSTSRTPSGPRYDRDTTIKAEKAFRFLLCVIWMSSSLKSNLKRKLPDQAIQSKVSFIEVEPFRINFSSKKCENYIGLFVQGFQLLKWIKIDKIFIRELASLINIDFMPKKGWTKCETIFDSISFPAIYSDWRWHLKLRRCFRKLTKVLMWLKVWFWLDLPKRMRGKMCKGKFARFFPSILNDSERSLRT